MQRQSMQHGRWDLCLAIVVDERVLLTDVQTQSCQLAALPEIKVLEWELGQEP